MVIPHENRRASRSTSDSPMPKPSFPGSTRPKPAPESERVHAVGSMRMMMRPSLV